MNEEDLCRYAHRYGLDKWLDDYGKIYGSHKLRSREGADIANFCAFVNTRKLNPSISKAYHAGYIAYNNNGFIPTIVTVIKLY